MSSKVIVMQVTRISLKDKIFNRLNNRFLKFCVVGASGIMVNICLLWALTEKIGLYYLISSAIGIEISIFTNFILNDGWTWKDVGGKRVKDKLNRGAKYNVICAAGLVINMTILWSMTELFGVNYLISNIFGITGAILWNFHVNDTVTWKNEI